MNSVQDVNQFATDTPPGVSIVKQNLADRLADVLRRALIATGGNGGAIALMHGNVMVTCARAGCAPDLGSHVNLDGSFAGLCVRTRRTLRSDHLENDPRANGKAWRALNICSMVVTPVRHGEAIVGVLAVFAHEPQAFLPNHGVALEILALALEITPLQERPPANHYPPPPRIRCISARESATGPPAPPRPVPQPPEAASANRVETQPPVLCTSERGSAVQPPVPPPRHPQASVTRIVRLPVAAVPCKPSPIAAILPSSASATKKVETPHILRFRRSERMLHWSIAVPFLVCFTSAMILVIFYNPHPQWAYRVVFSLLHRISGACLMVFPGLVLLRNRSDYRIHLYNIKAAFFWVTDDVKWLLLMGAAALNSKISLPEQGKFNAAEKLNFIMVLCTYPLYIATGLILWGLHVPVAAWMLHVGMAAMAAPLVLGHIFMATINPETRVGLSGMLTGYVDRHWAKHHYTLWYREQFESDHARGGQRGAKQAWPQPALVQCPSEAEG
jgi:formate dehydrogenase subunit gamma